MTSSAVKPTPTLCCRFFLPLVLLLLGVLLGVLLAAAAVPSVAVAAALGASAGEEDGVEEAGREAGGESFFWRYLRMSSMCEEEWERLENRRDLCVRK